MFLLFTPYQVLSDSRE